MSVIPWWWLKRQDQLQKRQRRYSSDSNIQQYSPKVDTCQLFLTLNKKLFGLPAIFVPLIGDLLLLQIWADNWPINQGWHYILPTTRQSARMVKPQSYFMSYCLGSMPWPQWKWQQMSWALGWGMTCYKGALPDFYPYPKPNPNPNAGLMVQASNQSPQETPKLHYDWGRSENAHMVNGLHLQHLLSLQTTQSAL